MDIRNPLLHIDAYKAYHHLAMHPEVLRGHYTFTNRSGKYAPNNAFGGVFHFGLQYYVKYYLGTLFDEWFSMSVNEAVGEYTDVMGSILGKEIADSHLRDLHSLGALPLTIKSIPEGALVPYGVASFTITTNEDGFAWLPGMLETSISNTVWPMQTAMTTAANLMLLLKRQSLKADLPLDMLPFRAHDFSARGMMGQQASAMVGAAHIAAGFMGSDTVAAVPFLQEYYNADFPAASVDATEHACTCSWKRDYEAAFLAHVLKQTPTGILSVVVDTYDMWNFLVNILPRFKEQILERDGKFVVRLDSGVPLKIICGDDNALGGTPENKGAYALMAQVFGEGEITSQHYKTLHPKVGLLYGDGMSFDSINEIGNALMDRGWAPDMVYGVGSYTYQGVTRDTHGSAIKMTAAYREDSGWYGTGKNPVTDKSKRSQHGVITFIDDHSWRAEIGDFSSKEEVPPVDSSTRVFDSGVIYEESLNDIQARVRHYVNTQIIKEVS